MSAILASASWPEPPGGSNRPPQASRRGLGRGPLFVGTHRRRHGRRLRLAYGRSQTSLHRQLTRPIPLPPITFLDDPEREAQKWLGLSEHFFGLISGIPSVVTKMMDPRSGTA